MATLMHDDTLTVSQFSFRVVVERPPSEDLPTRYLVTNYGPNRTMTSMVVAAILLSEDSKPLKKKWIGSKVCTNHRVSNQIGEFFEVTTFRRSFRSAKMSGAFMRKVLTIRPKKSVHFVIFGRVGKTWGLRSWDVRVVGRTTTDVSTVNTEQGVIQRCVPSRSG